MVFKLSMEVFGLSLVETASHIETDRLLVVDTVTFMVIRATWLNVLDSFDCFLNFYEFILLLQNVIDVLLLLGEDRCWQLSDWLLACCWFGSFRGWPFVISLLERVCRSRLWSLTWFRAVHGDIPNRVKAQLIYLLTFHFKFSTTKWFSNSILVIFVFYQAT